MTAEPVITGREHWTHKGSIKLCTLENFLRSQLHEESGGDNLHIARETFAAWNAHDVEGFLKRLDTKTSWESDAFLAPFTGHEGARQFFKVYVTAFPDLHLDIEQILAAGDNHVVVRWRSSGTHLGNLGDIPATGRKASNHGCTVMEVKNNKVGHAWVYFDNAHLLRQIGVLPSS